MNPTREKQTYNNVIVTANETEHAKLHVSSYNQYIAYTSISSIFTKG